MCCSFNMKKAEDILKESKYANEVSMRQKEEAILGFEDDTEPKWYLENNEPRPESGPDRGLKLIVDRHSDKLSAGTVVDDFRGFIMVVEDRNMFPLVSRSRMIARPGFENNVEISAIQQEANNYIRIYEPSKRNCYFPDEFDLDVHRHYSQYNCVFECKSKFASQCLETCTDPNTVCDCKNVSISQRLSLIHI